MSSLWHEFQADWYKLPNLVTLGRLVASPLPGLLLLVAPYDPTFRWMASSLFVVVATTDFLDGYLARSRNEVTDLGKHLDPTVDKVLVITACISLCVINPWVLIPTTVFIVREISVTIMRIQVSKHGQTIAATQKGKLKAVIQYAAVALLLAPVQSTWWLLLTWTIIIIAVQLTVSSWLDYVQAMRRIVDDM